MVLAFSVPPVKRYDLFTFFQRSQNGKEIEPQQGTSRFSTNSRCAKYRCNVPLDSKMSLWVALLMFCHSATHTSKAVPDRVTWSLLARSTRLRGLSSNVKICVAVYIILVQFV